jgi:hypothetical protein
VPKYGLIVEGRYDTPVFESLIRRLNAPDAEFFPIESSGFANLRKFLPAYLRRLETAFTGAPPDHAFIIRDSDHRGEDPIIRELKAVIGNRTFSFPYYFCVAIREMETWLLSDERAITAVAAQQGGRAVGYIPGTLEEFVNSKELLIATLSRARLPYTPATCGKIAATLDLPTLRYRCPAFGRFQDLFD